jgi:hypothetical protein
VPGAPNVGDKLVIEGAGTVKITPLLCVPPIGVTTTTPVVAPYGTAVKIEVLPQLLIVVAAVPLNVTVPPAVPKLVPVTVTWVPGTPDVGDKPVIEGA